jgi:hypothetical protein
MLFLSLPVEAQNNIDPVKSQYSRKWSNWAVKVEKDDSGNILKEKKFRIKKKKWHNLIDEITIFYSPEGEKEKTITKRIRTTCKSYKELRVKEK